MKRLYPDHKLLNQTSLLPDISMEKDCPEKGQDKAA